MATGKEYGLSAESTAADPTRVIHRIAAGVSEMTIVASRSTPISGKPAPRRRAKTRLRADRTPIVDPSAFAAGTLERFREDRDFIMALARGLAVLLSLSTKRRHMSIAQVTHRTGIPRPSARRCLHTLEQLGFVAFDGAGGFYLRPRVLSFSHAYLSASPISMLAQPILDRLGSTLLEACALAVLDGDDIVYLARSTGSPIISPVLNVGRRQPAYCTSIGHLLLASLPKDDLDASLKRVRFYPFTTHTIRSLPALRAALDAAREADYAYVSQQTELRLCSLAVPVRDASGACVAGINVILKGRLLACDEMVERYLRPIKHAASELGLVLAS